MNQTLNKIALSVLLLAACEEDTDGADEGAMQEEDTGDASGGSESSTGEEMNFEELYACEEPNFVEVMPLAGPGYDPAMGLLDPVQEGYIVSSTMIMVKPEQMGLFFELVGNVSDQLMMTDGFVAISLATEPTCGWARTLTVWRDDESMYKFVVAGAHAEAMSRTGEVAITGKVTSWPMTAEQMPPTWDVAKTQLAAVEPLDAGGY